jgi:hypothetical protein
MAEDEASYFTEGGAKPPSFKRRGVGGEVIRAITESVF